MKKLVALVLCLMLSLSLCVSASAALEPQGLPDVYPLSLDASAVSGVRPAPNDCFTATEKENGLAGSQVYLVGKEISADDLPGADAAAASFFLQTEYGYAAFTDAEDVPGDGEFIKVVCVYSGYSAELGMPLFSLSVLAGKQGSGAAPTAAEENAVRSAKNYLSFSAFSYSGLIKQLEYEGFTHEQAVYGADNSGADWFEQAAASAKNYLGFMAFSRDSLIAQLEYEGFTHEQAVYGAEQNGF